MLDTLSAMAIRSNWAKPVALIIGLMFLSTLLLSIFGFSFFKDDIYLIPSLVGALWSGLLFSFINIFPSLPKKPNEGLAFFPRIKIHLTRFIFSLLAFAFLAFSLVLILLSFKLFGIWRADF